MSLSGSDLSLWLTTIPMTRRQMDWSVWTGRVDYVRSLRKLETGFLPTEDRCWDAKVGDRYTGCAFLLDSLSSANQRSALAQGYEDGSARMDQPVKLKAIGRRSTKRGAPRVESADVTHGPAIPKKIKGRGLVACWQWREFLAAPLRPYLGCRGWWRGEVVKRGTGS
jgi:hypothetical protein